MFDRLAGRTTGRLDGSLLGIKSISVLELLVTGLTTHTFLDQPHQTPTTTGPAPGRLSAAKGRAGQGKTGQAVPSLCLFTVAWPKARASCAVGAAGR
jgi:hypothetical protein